MARWIIELSKSAVSDSRERSLLRRQEIAFQIRQVMADKDVTSRELSKRMGLAESRVSHMLSGKANMQLDTLYSIAEALDVPLYVRYGNSIRLASAIAQVDRERVGNLFPLKKHSLSGPLNWSPEEQASNDFLFSEVAHVS